MIESEYLRMSLISFSRYAALNVCTSFLNSSMAKPCLIEAACTHAIKISGHKGKGGKRSIGLQCVENLTACLFLHMPQDLHVFSMMVSSIRYTGVSNGPFCDPQESIYFFCVHWPALDFIRQRSMFYNLPGKSVFIQRLHKPVRVKLFDIKYPCPLPDTCEHSSSR